MQLAMCDPLAGTWEVLPTLWVNVDRSLLGYAMVVTGTDCCSSSSPNDSASFKALLVETVLPVRRFGYYHGQQEDAKEYIVHAF
jgi:hypothetical protein